MSKIKVLFFIALSVVVVAFSLLVTGSPLLTYSLNHDDNIPLGTFITWAGLVSLPLTIFWGIHPLRKPTDILSKILSVLIKLTIAFAIFWMPICYLLAGNISFSFSEKSSFQGGQTAMKIFWGFSFGLMIGSLTVLISYWISLMFNKKKTG